MKRPFPRALIFALPALIAWTLISMIVVAFIAGLPEQGETAAAYQARIVGPAARVDMVVGALVMFVFGYLAAKPFVQGEAVRTALLFGIVYLVLEIGTSLLLSGAGNIDLVKSLPTYAIKLAAALAGGFLAGRVASPAETSVQNEP